MKKFKTGEYYIFDANIKKIGKATIHGFVEVNGTKYAVVSYRDNDNVPYIKALPVCELNGRKAIFLLDAVFIFADAPVQPKVVKFKVGEIYTNNDDDKFHITNRYSNCLNGSMHLVLNDEIVADVKPDDDGVEHAEFYDGDDFKEIVAGKFTEDEEE